MTKILIDEAVVMQALEALESFADGIYYEDEEDSIGRRFCCRGRANIPHKENCAAAASTTALRQALADAALDKKADNAKELGLSYEQPAPAQQEPDLSEQGRTRSAILGNNVEAMMDAGLPFLAALETTLKVYDHDTAPKIGCVNHDCDQCKALAEQPAQAQEPVAKVDYKQRDGFRWLNFFGWQRIPDGTSLYTTPPAPAQPLTDEQEREAFEAYVANTPLGIYSTDRRGDGAYWSSQTQLMWDTWKARAAHSGTKGN